MRLSLRNLLEWLDQAGWTQKGIEGLREIVREPNRAKIWVERMRSVRANSAVSSKLDLLLGSEAMNGSSANLVAAFLDRKLDSIQTSEFERRVLQDDILLKDLILSDLSIRYAAREKASIPAELRQSVYGIVHHATLADKEPVTRSPKSGWIGDSEQRRADTIRTDEPSGSGHNFVNEPATTGEYSAPVNSLEAENDFVHSVGSRKTYLPLVLTLLLSGAIVISFTAGWWIANQNSKPSVAGKVEVDRDQESDERRSDDGTILNDDDAEQPTPIQNETERDMSAAASGPRNEPVPSRPVIDFEPHLPQEVPIFEPDRIVANENAEQLELHEGQGDQRERPFDAGHAEATVDPMPSMSSDTVLLGELMASTISVGEPLAFLAPAVPIATDNEQPNAAHVEHFPISDSQWVVAPSNQVFRQNQPLFVLRSSRPELTLNESCNVELIGPAWVTLRHRAAPGFDLRSGRAIVRATGLGQTVEIGNRFGVLQIELIEEFTELAIESRSYFPPGMSLLMQNEQHVMQVIVLQGSCSLVWADPAAPIDVEAHNAAKMPAATIRASSTEQIELVLQENAGDLHTDDAGSMETLLLQGQAQYWTVTGPIEKASQIESQIGWFETIPDWIQGESSKWLELARSQLNTEIEPGKPLLPQLITFLSHRRDEVRVIGLQNLIAVGNFMYVVDFFDAPRYRIYWSEILESFRYDLHQDSENAQRLSTSLELFESRKTDYHSLLLGYSVEQIQEKPPEAKQSDVASELVGLLEDNKLAIRVLALENLRLITGDTHLLRPDLDLDRRRKKIKKWQTVEINYAQTPSPDLIQLRPLERIPNDGI